MSDYGDCKDKHTLFAALLAAEGIKAYPVLIRAEGDTDNVDPDVPSPMQFSHVITAVPQDKGYLFLDTTPEVGPYGYLVPELRDKKALVMPDGSPASLVQTPADPPFNSLFTFQADAAIDDAGTLTGKMQFTARGDFEVIYRALFRQAGQPQWNDLVQRISSSLGFGGTVSVATATPPDETDVPLHVEYNYTRKEYSDWANRRIGPPFPAILLPDVPEDEDKNPKPLKLGTPHDFVYEATIKLPANSNPTLPSAVHFDGEVGTYQADYSFSNGVLHVERRMTRKVRDISPTQMDAYKKWKKTIEHDQEAYIPLFGGTSAFSDIAGSPEARALFDEGRNAWQKRDLGGAADSFQQAVDKDPKFAQAWYALGAVNLALGDTDEAVAALKKAAALDPNEPENYASMTSELIARHHEDDALAIWQQIEKENPQTPDSPRQVAAILIEMKRYTEAVPELESSTGRYPKDAYLQYQLATACFYTNSPDKGVASAKKALALDQTPRILNDVAYVLADNNTHLEMRCATRNKPLRRSKPSSAQ
jgi:tetratricopeptide (TPR) repeat protein